MCNLNEVVIPYLWVLVKFNLWGKPNQKTMIVAYNIKPRLW